MCYKHIYDNVVREFFRADDRADGQHFTVNWIKISKVGRTSERDGQVEWGWSGGGVGEEGSDKEKQGGN